VAVSIIDELTRQAGRIAGDVQSSIRRARVEGERRLMQRQHRAALEELGERAYELVKAGTLPGDALAVEVAAVEAKLMEIEAKTTEIDGLREDEGAAAPEAGATAPATPATDPSATAFPMVDGNGAPTPGGPGPGWEAAERFFPKG
jgi:hypothetical protein